MGRLQGAGLEVSQQGDDTQLTAHHNGYAQDGLRITRRLALSHDGARLTGLDRFEPVEAQTEEMASDAPTQAELRFHLSPDATARLERGRVLIRLGPPADTPSDLADEITAEYWALSATGAQDLRLEPSAWLDGGADEPRAALQIVLSAPLTGEAVRFDWTLAKARVTPSA